MSDEHGHPGGLTLRVVSELGGADQHQALLRARKARGWGGGDIVMHAQVRVSGNVGRDPRSQAVPVVFPYPIIYAPTRSDFSLPTPQFTSGVIKKTTHILDVSVEDWINSKEGWYTGALVRVTAFAPNAGKVTPFTATLHLTFFGYAVEVTDADEEG